MSFKAETHRNGVKRLGNETKRFAHCLDSAHELIYEFGTDLQGCVLNKELFKVVVTGFRFASAST